MKRVLGTILFVIYAIIAIAVTVLLLSYNDYNNSVIGDYTVYIVKDDSLEPEYKQGSILLIKETNDRNVQVGDKIFMYKVLNSSEYEVVNTTLQGKTQQGNHVVYLVDNDERYANEYFIGKVDDTIVIEGWGYILNLLESRWGYLFCIVVVSLLLFLQEVFELVMEIKYLNKRKKKAALEVEAEEDDEEYDDEYDEDEYDDEDYDDTPRFKIVRIILGILSLAGFAFFVYRGFVTGINGASDGSVSGTTYIILALCMLVAAILYFILQNRNTIFAFLLPMLFYLGSTVVAFVQRGDDMQLLISAIVSAVLAVLSLILAIASRGGDDYDDEDEDYDDPFEEEHDN